MSYQKPRICWNTLRASATGDSDNAEDWAISRDKRYGVPPETTKGLLKEIRLRRRYSPSVIRKYKINKTAFDTR